MTTNNLKNVTGESENALGLKFLQRPVHEVAPSARLDSVAPQPENGTFSVRGGSASGQFLAHPLNSITMAKMRVDIKRQLRIKGITIPPEINENLEALRQLLVVNR